MKGIATISKILIY